MIWAIVFKGLEIHQIYEKSDHDWPGTMFLTNKGFSYAVFSNGDWHCLTKTKDSVPTKVNKDTVPSELRAIALLLEIPG